MPWLLSLSISSRSLAPSSLCSDDTLDTVGSMLGRCTNVDQDARCAYSIDSDSAEMGQCRRRVIDEISRRDTMVCMSKKRVEQRKGPWTLRNKRIMSALYKGVHTLTEKPTTAYQVYEVELAEA